MPLPVLKRVLASLSSDGRVLFATRTIRLFAYGLLSIVLALYLSAVGLTDPQIGLLLTLTLAGDIVISFWLTTSADRKGRRRTLVVGAALMVLAAGVFVSTASLPLLLLAAVVGVISPSGNEVGPFLPIEQAALAQTITDAHERTGIFAWYNLVGSLATACGALVGGLLTHGLRAARVTPVASYRVALLLYAAAGIVLIVLFVRLTGASEPTVRSADAPAPPTIFGLHRSRGVVAKLSALFALDAFGGGFVVQAILAYWFHVRFGADVSVLGAIFFGANVLAAFSALAAAAVARRIGLINTMVFTHLPSNVLLLLVPLMPNLPLAAAVLLLRFSISQMDVPTRQSYTVAVVDEDERSAAAGITGIARSVGACLPPLLTGYMLTRPGLMSLPFFLAGGIKIVYDLLLYRSFSVLKPPAR